MAGGETAVASLGAKEAFATDSQHLPSSEVFASEHGQAQYEEAVGKLHDSLSETIYTYQQNLDVTEAETEKHRQAVYTDAWAQRGLTPDDLSTILTNWESASPLTHARLLAAWDQRHAGNF